MTPNPDRPWFRRLRPSILLVLPILVLLAAPSLAEEAGEDSGATAGDLAWLAGCWAADGGDPGSGESWIQPAGGTLLGVNRTVQGGRTVAHEFLMIVPHDDAGLAYVAMPSGQERTVFPLARIGKDDDDGNDRVVFENPEHDFPQRILYSRTGDRLVARIEGSRPAPGGQTQTRGIDFPMHRVDCEAPPAAP